MITIPVALLFSTAAAAAASTLTTAQLEHLRSSLREVRSRQTFVHVVELGCTDTAAQAAGHESVASWSVLCHEPERARRLLEQHSGSSSVTVKLIEGAFASWGRADAELQFFDGDGGGTLAEFESLVAELKFFGAKDKNEYWVLALGAAQADVAVGALPLLASRGGRLVVPDWGQCVRETVLFFYLEESVAAGLHVLKPKPIDPLDRAPSDPVAYPWCFSWPGGTRVALWDGPADTEASMARVTELVPCSSFAGAFQCDPAKRSGGCRSCKGGEDGCVPCEVAMLAVTRRGFAVTHSLDKLMALQPRPQHQHAEL